jgi:hypothetical protein
MVNEHKLRYLAASKVEKPKVAREVVQRERDAEAARLFDGTRSSLCRTTDD